MERVSEDWVGLSSVRSALKPAEQRRQSAERRVEYHGRAIGHANCKVAVRAMVGGLHEKLGAESGGGGPPPLLRSCGDPQRRHGTFFGGKDRKTLYGIVFYGAGATPSARNAIIAIPTLSQDFTGGAK